MRALQKQLTSTDRQAAVSEIALRNVTNERDSAVSQLGVAFFTIEQLKADNANLSSENEALRTELAVAQGAQNKHVRHTIAKSDQHPTRHEQKPEVVVSVDPPPCKADMSKVRREQTTDEPQRSSFEQFKEKLALRQAEREAREASAAQAGAKSPGRDETSENRVSVFKHIAQ